MVFGSPTQLGARLQLASPWLVPLAILAVISLALVAFMPAEILQQTVEAQSPGGAQEGQQASISQVRTFGIIGAALGTFIGAAVVAGVLYLIFNVIFGQAETSYRQHLSAVSHAWWILIIGSVLEFALKLAQGDGSLRLGLGLLLAEAPSSFLGHFLSNITLFGLWTAGALGAVESGLSAGKVTVGKAAVAVITLYLAFAAISAVFPTLAG